MRLLGNGGIILCLGRKLRNCRGRLVIVAKVVVLKLFYLGRV